MFDWDDERMEEYEMKLEEEKNKMKMDNERMDKLRRMVFLDVSVEEMEKAFYKLYSDSDLKGMELEFAKMQCFTELGSRCKLLADKAFEDFMKGGM